MKRFALFVCLIAAAVAIRNWEGWYAVTLVTKPPERVLRMPVKGVGPAHVANTWHAPRPGGRRHEGQDIFAPRGTPVVAAAEGIVVRVGTNRLGGNTVSIVGAGGRVYYYAHLDRYAENIGPGDFVPAGAVIGYVGNTGNARGTPPHLHFGVYSALGALNPLPLLLTPDPV